MMHGHEKSDSAIVAMKPPNNAGRPTAEAVERRAGAKENANRCCTCRTQGRESGVPGAGARTEGREASRQSSEVGAVCRKAARTVLCGGRPVMGVPTAIARRLRFRDWALARLRRCPPTAAADNRWRLQPKPAIIALGRSCIHAEPEVRIHSPPAKSLQTFGPWAADASA